MRSCCDRKENVTLYFAQEKSVLQHMGVLDWLDKITLGHIKQTGKDPVIVSDMLIFISPEANPDLARWAQQACSTATQPAVSQQLWHCWGTSVQLRRHQPDWLACPSIGGSRCHSQ
jgi:hypothetical protein